MLDRNIYHLKMREDAYGIGVFVVPLMARSCRLELHTEVLRVEMNLPLITEEMILDMRSRGGPERLIAPLAASRVGRRQRRMQRNLKKHGSYTYNK